VTSHLRSASAVALAGIVAATLGAGPAKADETKVVLELFTSQGCSSCPPADKLFTDYVNRDDILALSFSVDYWDYLGWKDTLANRDFSERQRDYAAARGDRQVYTPQMVINGGEHVVGSNRAAIDAALVKSEAKGLSVPITMTPSDHAITVNIGAGSGQSGTLWLVMYDLSVSVPIARGENSGSTITYHNVVRKLRPIAMWKGEPMSVDLPRSEMTQAKVSRCAVLLQKETANGLPGEILGASTLRSGK
jgi:hypothetical protein